MDGSVGKQLTRGENRSLDEERRAFVTIQPYTPFYYTSIFICFLAESKENLTVSDLTPRANAPKTESMFVPLIGKTQPYRLQTHDATALGCKPVRPIRLTAHPAT